MDMIEEYWWVQDPDGGAPQPARCEFTGEKATMWIIGLAEDVNSDGWRLIEKIQGPKP